MALLLLILISGHQSFSKPKISTSSVITLQKEILWNLDDFIINRKEFPETLGGTYLFKVKDKEYFGSALSFIHRLIEHRYEIKKKKISVFDFL